MIQQFQFDVPILMMSDTHGLYYIKFVERATKIEKQVSFDECKTWEIDYIYIKLRTKCQK